MRHENRDEFLSFVALTEDELDEVCDRLRRKFGAGIFSAAGTSRKEQVGKHAVQSTKVVGWDGMQGVET